MWIFTATFYAQFCPFYLVSVLFVLFVDPPTRCDILSMIIIIDIFETEHILIEKVIFQDFNSDGSISLTSTFSSPFELDFQSDIYFDTLKSNYFLLNLFNL